MIRVVYTGRNIEKTLFWARELIYVRRYDRGRVDGTWTILGHLVHG